MPNRLIPTISENTSITKSRLVSAINEAISEINQIHELYDKFFESPNEQPALAQQIENQLNSIKGKYVELFEKDGSSVSKVEDLDIKIQEIRDFHKELLEGDGSIQHDIRESQDRIADFYVKLFQTYETDDDGGQEAKLQQAFSSIVSFDEQLNKTDVGYKDKIEKATAEILDAHKELLGKDKKSNLSKIDLLNKHITEANEFHEKVQKEISPFMEESQETIKKIASDIEAKQSEVDSLLLETTIGTLSEGYMQAMQIYGDPVYGKPPKKGFAKKFWYSLRSAAKAIKHFVKFFGSYLLFIGPLILIGWIFVSDLSQDILKSTQDGGIEFSGTEYIIYKLTIALPLLWVSWYGQKSISHRKRLFEEYNHKLRVVQMYLRFITKSETYVLNEDARVMLEGILLDAIKRNPSEVYGKDETLIDKLVGIFHSEKDSDSNVPNISPATVRPKTK